MGVGDRVLHGMGFLGLALWFSGIAAAQFYLPLGAALLAFGVALEGLQYVTGLGRVADLGDVGANAVGIAVGIALARAGIGEWMRWVERLLRVR